MSVSTSAAPRPRTWPIIAILLVLIAAAAAALVIQAATPACGRVAATVTRSETTLRASGEGWSTGPPIIGARGEMGAAVVDGRIVLAGGLAIADGSGSCGVSIASTVAYDPLREAWEERAPMPGPRDHPAVAAWEGLLYLSGGGEFARGTVHPNLWAYDAAADRWSDLAPMPAPRWQHAMAALDGMLIVVGGFIGGATDDAAVWAYDVESGAWRTNLAPMPTVRDHLAAVVAEGRLIVLGGRSGPNLSTVEIYDPATDTWTSGPDMSTPRGGFAAGVLSDGIHVAGGEEFDPVATIASHERLDPTSWAWMPKTDLPTPRHGLASAVVDDRWYVIGGGLEVGLSTSDIVEAWTP